MSDESKIESLPESLTRSFPEVVLDYQRVGISTKPTDKVRAEAGVRMAYEAAGLPAPRYFIWTKSPLEGVLAATLVKEFGVLESIHGKLNLDKLPREKAQIVTVHQNPWSEAWKACIDGLEEKLYNEVRDDTAAIVLASVGPPLKDQINSQFNESFSVEENTTTVVDRSVAWGDLKKRLGSNAINAVFEAFRPIGTQLNPITDAIRSQLVDEVGKRISSTEEKALKESIWKQLDTMSYGQHSAEWLAFYTVFRDLVPECGKLAGVEEVARSAGWWWPFRNAVVLSERPLELLRDPLLRLHAEDGPALLYRDGFAIFAWHGMRIPRDYIEAKDEITPKRMLAENNAELRRVMTEIYGFDRLIKDLNGVKVGEDVELDLKREMWDVKLGDRQTLRIVKVINGTLEADGRRREFFLGMPTNARTPKDAIAWSYGINPDQFREDVRT